MDFDTAVFIFSVSHWPLILRAMACHFLVLIMGLGTWRFFSVLVLPTQLSASCVTGGGGDLHPPAPLLTTHLLLSQCCAGSGIGEDCFVILV